MAEVQLRKTFRVLGVATDVTSFTLGVIRVDTSAVVVAAGTAMTRVATGVYTYAFDPPVAGLSYVISYALVHDGVTSSFSETKIDTSDESIPMPELTGNTLADTLASLEVERLRVARNGPKPSYNLHGHRVDWTQYLRYLDERILAVRKEIIQTEPWEEVGLGI